MLRRCVYLLALLLYALNVRVHAQEIPVRHAAGTLHGFLTAHAIDGKIIAEADLTQIVRADRVTIHLVFHFKDGSLDDETTVYTQHGHFRLISDHHIQRGPYFPQPMETTIDARSGRVTVRSTGKDGKEEVETEHMKLPLDLANGMTGIVAQNVLPNGAPETVSMVVTTPKPRLVKLVFTPKGEEPFSIAGFPRKSTRIEMKIDLGCVAGVVAPLIGKQPGNFNLWVLEDEVPVLLKETGYLYQDGPPLTFYFASPSWPQSADEKIVTGK